MHRQKDISLCILRILGHEEIFGVCIIHYLKTSYILKVLMGKLGGQFVVP